MMDAKKRFSSRVQNYIQYRPGYPLGLTDLLCDACGLSSQSAVADIGSGTGLLSRVFLELGCRVYGVEPNLEMRMAGDQLLARFPAFSSGPGSAEESGLPSSAVDFVTAGQAFHWFDPGRARNEFQRILRDSGWVVLVWNERRIDSTPFLREYEVLLNRFGTDYADVNHMNVENDPRAIPEFFGGAYQVVRLDNQQVFDFAGVKGRLLSSSYAPEAGHPNHEPMLAELERIFDRHQQNGQISFEYDTRIYYGRITQ